MTGCILAGLGADVIKVEPPGGDPGRQVGPYLRDRVHLENGIPWICGNVGKRSLTLSLESEEGRALLRQLAAVSDFLIESFAPGYLDSRGLGYQTLRAINPDLIMTSITPFGQTGPLAHYRASDIVIMAMGGFMGVTGDSDRAPVRVSVEQAAAQAGAQAAVGSLIALHERQSTGHGEHVDVSMQESIAYTMNFELQWWFTQQRVVQRAGVRRFRGRRYIRTVWPCKDGEMAFWIMPGKFGAPTMRALMEWMEEEGKARSVSGVDWENLDAAEWSQEDVDQWEAEIGEFLRQHTKEQIFAFAVRRGILICPVFDPRELLQYRQLDYRGYWTELEHPLSEDRYRFVGSFCGLPQATPAVTNRQRAPLCGEHTRSVLEGLLGLSRKEIATLSTRGVV
ncbi:MAG: CoA transferase [Chloroflexi bacterium]|nr:CoA transferase [Chloroflexota bacterium]